MKWNCVLLFIVSISIIASSNCIHCFHFKAFYELNFTQVISKLFKLLSLNPHSSSIPWWQQLFCSLFNSSCASWISLWQVFALTIPKNESALIAQSAPSWNTRINHKQSSYYRGVHRSHSKVQKYYSLNILRWSNPFSKRLLWWPGN